MSNLVPRDPIPGHPQGLIGGAAPHGYADQGGARGGSWPNGQPPPPNDSIELSELLQILRRRIWLILACVLVGGALAWGVHEIREPRYRATAVIQIEDPRTQMSERLGSVDPARSGADPIRSSLEVLRSRTVLAQIVDEEGLRLIGLHANAAQQALQEVTVEAFALDDTLTLEFSSTGLGVTSARGHASVNVSYGQRATVGGISFRVDEHPGVDQASFELLSRDQAIELVGRNLTSQPRPETNVVDVSYTATDPDVAQRLANRAVQVFQARTASEARAESQRRRQFLEEQLAVADTTLREAQGYLTAFRSDEQVVSTQAQGTEEQLGLINIEMRREELLADRSMYQSILGELGSADPGEMGERIQAIVATPEVAANPVVSSLHAQLMELETERQALTSGPWGLSQTNPDVARIDQQIATTGGRLESAVRSHMQNLDARLAAMTDLRARTAAQIAGRPQALAEEERLLQDVASIRRTMEQLQDEFYRARMAEAVEEGPVQIVDLAPTPHTSEQAGLPLMLVLGLMLGAMVGSGGAFLLEMLNTKVRRREDMEDAMQVTTMGIIPRLSSGGRKRLKHAAASSNGARGGRELVTLHESRSSEAEAFRTLRTNLLYAQHHKPLRAVVVASANPGEGKTTTAANLAITYAQQGLSVVLVDCDLRKPRVGELFGMERRPGMTELVLGQATLEECARPFVPAENLFILPSGTLPPNPTELLGGARTREVLQVLQENFDMVILDSPPLSGGADSSILGAAVDGVIMVVRAGETEIEAVRYAARQLHTVGATLLGSVMNDPDGEAEKYGAYYSYGYYGSTE
ncbi:MAG: polysaccharide biosynthesis tyrosine autokinase [Gemmatimonadales bacterium]|nr:MAG: polysaccharide biosynthesis tyrosine autokinase [Gemmatimonadales bacterium]